MIIPEQDTPKSNITLGNLYDMNKDLVKKHEQMISLNDFKEKYSIFNEYLTNNSATYYMLLCNEERDYTLFNFIHEWTDDIKHFAHEIHRSSNRLLTTINDIIRLSELDSAYGNLNFIFANKKKKTMK